MTRQLIIRFALTSLSDNSLPMLIVAHVVDGKVRKIHRSYYDGRPTGDVLDLAIRRNPRATLAQLVAHVCAAACSNFWQQGPDNVVHDFVVGESEPISASAFYPIAEKARDQRSDRPHELTPTWIVDMVKAVIEPLQRQGGTVAVRVDSDLVQIVERWYERRHTDAALRIED